MEKNVSGYKTVVKIAIPITLQALLQSSFSVVDEIMIGQMGSNEITGIGLAGKFASIFSVLIAAVAAVAGIMISQYIGQKEEREVGRSFYLNLSLGLGLAVLFTLLSSVFANGIMGIYTKDAIPKKIAVTYLRIISVTFIPIALNTMFSTFLRCKEAAALPLVTTIVATLINTGLNYMLIGGHFGAPALGVEGAAIATVASQVISTVILFILFLWYKKRKAVRLDFLIRLEGDGRKQYLAMLLPILLNELLWSIGENIYAVIYGRIGTLDCAAMTLTIPIQTLMIGAMSGLAQATGIVVGRTLGEDDEEGAYRQSKKLMFYAFMGAAVLSVLLIFLRGVYVNIYNVEPSTKEIAGQILIAFAIISPVKVMNMTLGGGILRSGGKTKYILVIDLIGTWIFGVPLGFMAAFWWKLSIPYVYFILSLEECVRLAISLIAFKRRVWVNRL